MKNHISRRILALLITLAMVIGFVTPVFGAISDFVGKKQTVTGKSANILKMVDIDPSALNIKTLSEVLDTGEGVEISEDLPYGLDDTIRVSIFLKTPSAIEKGFASAKKVNSAAGVAYRKQLRAEQDKLISKIRKEVGELEIKWQLTLTTNAISVSTTLRSALLIAYMDGVDRVEIENIYNAPEAVATDPDQLKTAGTSEYMIGASAAWEAGYTGAGTLIAIIDTGVNAAHQSFDAEAFEYALAETGKEVSLLGKEDLAEIIPLLNVTSSVDLTADDLYYSSKVPFAANYVEPGEDFSNEYSGKNHGSHVAGIAAANRYIKTADGGFENAAEAVGVVGMAPDAQIVAMEVFLQGGGTYDSDYMAALEDALTIGCDAANLSLGSIANGFTYTTTYQELFNALSDGDYNNEMIVACAMGNAGYFSGQLPYGYTFTDAGKYYTGDSPASFYNSLGVASADNIYSKNPAFFFGDLTVAYNESSYSNAPFKTLAGGELEFVYLDSVGSPEEWEEIAGMIENKVAICNRGSLTFVEKANGAVENGAIGVIIANNQTGSITMELSSYNYTAPCVIISLDDALAIKEQATEADHTNGGAAIYTGTFEVSGEEVVQVIDREVAKMSDFSSWGVPGSLIMKPEITAPGGNINSVNGLPTGEDDLYELGSGTSMATPHIAGLSAIIAQYLDENDISIEGYSKRAVIQSLLMSTATPMVDWDNYCYYSILQQGSGLVDVLAALTADSVITMSSDDGTLTALTGAAADGKVKAEFGDDPDRTGVYTYKFTVHNISDSDRAFDLDTYIFTQTIFWDYLDDEDEYWGWFNGNDTWGLGADVEYSWLPDRDIDKNGVIDSDDAQAILDYLTGKIDGEELDLDRADMDGDGDITTYDAYLLLNWDMGDILVVPAGMSKEVTVTISLTEEEKDFLDYYYYCGAYIEGFTWVESYDLEEDEYVTSHSIPLLGYYGSFTDTNMFDDVELLSLLYYEDEQYYSYTAELTNFITIRANSIESIVFGNQYAMEEDIPYDRFAMSSDTLVDSVYYTLINNAGTTAFAASKVDGYYGDIEEVLGVKVDTYNKEGLYYNENDEEWENTSPSRHSIGLKIGDLGLSEGDTFRLAQYAFPEYTAMRYYIDNGESLLNNTSGMLDDEAIKSILLNGDYGWGAWLGYDFVLDDTAPVIESAVFDEETNTITVTLSDNENLAYLAITDIDGFQVFRDDVPATNKYQYTFEVSDIIDSVMGYIAIFAADYAGNETAVAVQVNDITSYTDYYYVLTDTLEAGKEYVIADSNEPGEWAFMIGNDEGTVFGTDYDIDSYDYMFDGTPFFNWGELPEMEWTLTGVNNDILANGGYYLTADEEGLTLSTSQTNASSWKIDAEAGTLVYEDEAGNTFYAAYDYDEYEWVLDEEESNLYFYEKVTVVTEIDPYTPSYMYVYPEVIWMYPGYTTSLYVTIYPLTAEDKTYTLTVEDSDIAVVDESGLVTAIAEGDTVITVVANGNEELYYDIELHVIRVDKQVTAIVYDENGDEFFSSIDMKDVSAWEKLHENGYNKQLYSTFIQNDTLYALTLNTNDATSEVYTVDPDTFEIAPLEGSELSYYATGAAPVPYGYAELNPDMFFQTFGEFLILSSLNGGFYTAWSFNNDYIAAITPYYIDEYDAGYILLTESGELLYVQFDEDLEAEYYSTVAELPFEAGYVYQDIYYDGEYLYVSHYSELDNTSMFLVYDIDREGFGVLAGDVGDSIWPVMGMYDITEPYIYVEEDETPDADGESLDVIKVDRISDEEIASVNARLTAKSAVSASDGAVKLPAQGTIALPDSFNPVMNSASSVTNTEERSAEVKYTEVVDATNGFAVITYDAETLTFKGAESTADCVSIVVDEENGTITFAFADTDGIAAGDALLTVYFDSVGCADSPATIVTTEFNSNLDLEDLNEFSVKGVGHSYGDPAYTWADDHSTCTATMTCSECGDEIKETVTATPETDDPDCENSGKTTYTATFENESFETQTAEVVLNPTGHSYGEPTYTWSDDHKTCTAKSVCADCNDEIKETVDSTSETTDPSCEEGGKTVYTATFTNELFEKQTKEVTVDPTGHDWEYKGFDWAEDFSSAEAVFVCKNDETHEKRVEATVTSTTQGKQTIYHASATLDGQVYEDDTVVVPQTGDDNAVIVYSAIAFSALVLIAAAVVIGRKRKSFSAD